MRRLRAVMTQLAVFANQPRREKDRMSITILHRTLAATAAAVLITAIAIGAALSAGAAGLALAALGATGGTAIGASGIAAALAFMEVRHQRDAIRVGTALERGLSPPSAVVEEARRAKPPESAGPPEAGEYVNREYRAAA